MSHSTDVKVTIGQTTIGYLYYSGSVAARLGITQLHKPVYFTGDHARRLLDTDILPDGETAFAQGVLARYDAEIGADDDEYEAERNQRLRDAISVTVTRHD